MNTILFTLIHQGVGYWPLLDRVFVVLTSYIAYGVVVLTLIYMLCIRPFLAKDPTVRTLRLAAGAEVALSIFITWVLVWVCKVLVAAPRPFVVLTDVFPLVKAASFESFPSGHAALAMATALAVLPYRKHLGHLLIAFSFVVALSRLYVGVHYPFDVGVGLLIGYLVSKLIHWVFKK